MQDWRLIPYFTASGALQMAIDEWLLDRHRAGESPPVLRFYGWSPAAISLGYHQRRYPARWHDIPWQGQALDLVRRPSGGRAVLHQGDLTYAIITSGVKGDRSTVYRTLCQPLIDGFQRLGIPLQYGVAGRGYIHNPNCFGTATAADLVLANDTQARGTKLIGSAQLKRGQAILQHGSIRLQPHRELFAAVFAPKTDASADVPLDAQSQSQPHEPWPTMPDPEAVIAAITTAAAQGFGARFTVQPLSEQEWEMALAQSQKWHIPAHGSETDILG